MNAVIRTPRIVRVAAILVLLATPAVARADALMSYWNFNNTVSTAPSSLFRFSSTDTGFQDGLYSASLNIPNGPAGREVIGSTYSVFGGENPGVFPNDGYADVTNLAGTPGNGATSVAGENDTWGSYAGNVLNSNPSDPSPFAGGSLSVLGSANNNRSVVFSSPTTGYQDLKVTYATRGTSTGYDFHTWGYSTDGVTFTDLPAILAAKTSTWVLYNVDFSAVAALDNVSRAFFRVTFNGATSTNGNNRLDNLQIRGEAIQAAAVPIPAAALAGVLCLSMLGLRRNGRAA